MNKPWSYCEGCRQTTPRRLDGVCMACGTSAAQDMGRKDDAEKDPWHLLPWLGARAVVRVLAFGARKYSPGGWRKVENARDRYYSAAIRHLVAWYQGERNDPESSESHLAHACACVLFLLEIEVAHEKDAT